MYVGHVYFFDFYCGIATGISFLAASHGVRPVWFLATAFSLGLALLATIDFNSNFLQFIKLPSYLLAVLWGFGLIATGISLAVHFSVVKDLSTVTHPGLVGGLLFLALQILYLPNVAITALAYVAGFGFSLGSGTHISPTHFILHEIPAIPLLGALPTGEHKFALYFSALGAVAAVLIVFYININKIAFRDRQLALVKTIFYLGTVVAVFSYLASGELVTSAMSPVGAPWWKLPVVSISAIAFSALLIQYIPLAIAKVRNRA